MNPNNPLLPDLRGVSNDQVNDQFVPGPPPERDVVRAAWYSQRSIILPVVVLLAILLLLGLLFSARNRGYVEITPDYRNGTSIEGQRVLIRDNRGVLGRKVGVIVGDGGGTVIRDDHGQLVRDDRGVLITGSAVNLIDNRPLIRVHDPNAVPVVVVDPNVVIVDPLADPNRR